MASYRLSALAEADLRGIAASALARWGTAQARSYLAELDKTLRLLALQPELGRQRDEIAPGARSFPCGKHIFFYRSAPPEYIEVARVLHQHMDVLNQFQDEF
ncbi:type II toxin-antitoxin system RelE/ParE family toxin [Rheinheimera tilapiae]|uniref:Toxin n=1 Tax=Rheinheimera tilapiae TaxID=875043 RepID=A0ABV6B8V2_9GAMM